MEHFDVVVVGCGPVGQTLAALLGGYGHRVAVIERHARPFAEARATSLDGSALRIWQAAGVADAIRRGLVTLERYDWVDAEGALLMRFDLRGDEPSGWGAQHLGYQPGWERALDARVASCDTVSLRRGWTVTGLDGDGHGVTLDVEHDSDRDTLRGAFVIGADGANSTVGALLGVPVTDHGFRAQWLVTDLLPHRDLGLDPAVQRCDPARPASIVALGHRRRRWEFMLLPGEAARAMAEEAAAWRLLAPWVGPDDATLERHAVYEFRSVVADRWRMGRVLLAGDAAHRMPPFLGQGLCAGLRDAANLSWKLDLVLRGVADEALLDSYEVERRPHVTAVVAASMGLGQVVCETDVAAAADLHAQLRSNPIPADGVPPPPQPPVTTGAIDAGDTGPMPPAGEPVPQGRLVLGGTAARGDDLLGGRVGLLALDRAVAVLAAGDQERLRWLGAVVVTLDDGSDPDGGYRAFLDRHGAVAAIQRPDGVCFGAAREPAAVPALIARLGRALRLR